MKKQLLYIVLLIVNSVFANVTLPAIFSDHMVLQQNEEVTFWGWASPNEEVQIQPSWAHQVYKVKAKSDAKWSLKVKTPKAGRSYSITISGYNSIVIKDVLIGEIWLCSGQSNMEMSASWGIKDGEKDAAKANHPTLRFFRLEKSSADDPQDHIIGKWEVCTPETMIYNSAVAYYFARQLQDNLENIPVGLIISAWGGTAAEIWMPQDIFKSNKVLAEAASKHKQDKWGPIEPASAFNAMIYPITDYHIAGALWYQGETNVGSLVYEQTLSALILAWRNAWQTNFPFYIVQIAPFDDGYKHFGGVEIRDAQRRVARATENTEMVVISDVSPTDDIHPKDKRPVGIRLANLALKKHYKVIDGLVDFPEIDSITYKKEKTLIQFKHAKGLYVKGSTSLFEIAGEDDQFYPAKIKLNDDRITLTSKHVIAPNQVRFAWGNTLQSNVFNAADLPLSSFKSEKPNH